MKKLFVSALLLTGLLATAQEPVKKQTQTTTQSTTTTARPASDSTATATAPAQTTVKTEATTKEEKAVPKKAEPAKKTK